MLNTPDNQPIQSAGCAGLIVCFFCKLYSIVQRPFLLPISMSIHIPVLPTPILELLDIQPGQTIIDGTFGGGGHSKLFSEKVGPTGRVIGFDRDPSAIAAAESWAPDNMTLVAANYADIPEHLVAMNIESVDAVLLDLGLSSDQLDDHNRRSQRHTCHWCVNPCPNQLGSGNHYKCRRYDCVQ